MTSSELLKTEAITLEFETWTFDPSVLIAGTEQGDEDFFSFPPEIEDLFDEYGVVIYARNAEVFERTEVDGKEAFVSAGVQPIVLIDEAFAEDDESEPRSLLAGGKVLFYGDTFLITNPKAGFARL